jgi:hypothetical protein
MSKNYPIFRIPKRSKLGEADAAVEGPIARELSQDELRLLAEGRIDTTTMAKVTVTIYTTPEFRYFQRLHRQGNRGIKTRILNICSRYRQQPRFLIIKVFSFNNS